MAELFDSLAPGLWGRLSPVSLYNFVILALTVSEKFVGGGIFDGVFRDNFRPEVVNSVISGVDVELVGMDVLVKFDNSRSNRSRDFRLSHVVTDDE